jgi:ankyrin repeat protein
LLQTFVNFGKPPQVLRLLKKWNYDEKLDLTWGDQGNTGTVLMEASLRGRDDIVRILCDSGANINLASPSGWTALHCASRANKDAVVRNKEAVVRTLLENGANPEAKTEDNLTPLDLAKGQRAIVNLLEEYVKGDKKGFWRKQLTRLGFEKKSEKAR